MAWLFSQQTMSNFIRYLEECQMFLAEKSRNQTRLTKSRKNGILYAINLHFLGGEMFKSIVIQSWGSTQLPILYGIFGTRCIFMQLEPRAYSCTINLAEEIIAEIEKVDKIKNLRFYNMLILRKHRPFYQPHEIKPHLEFCEIITQHRKHHSSTDFKHTRIPDEIRDAFRAYIPDNIKQKSDMVASGFGREIFPW